MCRAHIRTQVERKEPVVAGSFEVTRYTPTESYRSISHHSNLHNDSSDICSRLETGVGTNPSCCEMGSDTHGVAEESAGSERAQAECMVPTEPNKRNAGVTLVRLSVVDTLLAFFRTSQSEERLPI